MSERVQISSNLVLGTSFVEGPFIGAKAATPEGHSAMPVTSFSHKGFTVTVTIERDDDGSWRSRVIARNRGGAIRLPPGKYSSRKQAEQDVPNYIKHWLREI